MAEAAVSALGVYGSRPTVRVDTLDYPIVSELLETMEMVEQEGGMSALELRLANVASRERGDADYAFEDDRVLRLGAQLSVYTGDASEPVEIFSGVVTGLEGEFPTDRAPVLLVLAEDALQRARMTRRSRVHEDVSLRDLASSIANDLGLDPVVTGLDGDVGTFVQLNESDLAFLRRVLAKVDGDVQVVGTELHVSRVADVARSEVALTLHSQLRSARVLADLSQQVSEVSVAGWDQIQGQEISATSSGAHSGPGSGRTGAQVLTDTLGERAEHVGHLAPRDDTEARALADAAFDDRARRFLRLDGTAVGNPAIRVGTTVSVRGLGSRFDNAYYVVSARHRFDENRGYETDFTAECAFMGQGT